MRRVGLVLVLAALVTPLFSSVPAASAGDCWYDPAAGSLKCSPGGTLPGGPGDPPGERPPIRYVYTSVDSTGADCHYWSRRPGGVDAWDPANDPLVIRIVTTTPVCPVSSESPTAAAWRIFRSFPLAVPSPSLEPRIAGITGLPTYLAAPDPADITHTEILPDGRALEVRAAVVALRVDWGDGTAGEFDPSDARSYPVGTVTHAYTTKTCDAQYRYEHPSGRNCHPAYDAYPITATFTWVGVYRVGGRWIDLGTLDRTTTLRYDVDEVQGVLEP